MVSEALDHAQEVRCYRELLQLLHPGGLECPRCNEKRRLAVHRRHRDPVLDYRCLVCGRVFNAWTQTPLHKTHHRPSELALILATILRKGPTSELARRLGCQRCQLQRIRVRLQPWVWRSLAHDAIEGFLSRTEEVSRLAPPPDHEGGPRTTAEEQRRRSPRPGAEDGVRLSAVGDGSSLAWWLRDGWNVG